MKKIILIILIAFTFSSCGSWFSPDVEVINATINGSEIDNIEDLELCSYIFKKKILSNVSGLRD